MTDHRKKDSTRLCSLFALALVATMCTAQLALATTMPPKAEPAPSSPSTSKADAAAQAAARAQAGAKAGSKATSAIGDVSPSQAVHQGGDRLYNLSLFPVFTPPMARSTEGCAARINQQSTNVAVIGHASAETDPTFCNLMELRNTYIDACQYGSAKAIQDQATAALLERYKRIFTPSAAVFPDLDAVACGWVKAEPAAKAQGPVNLVAGSPAVPEPAASAPATAVSAATRCDATPSTSAAAKPTPRTGAKRSRSCH